MLEFKFQPFPILETKRMILRKLGKEDMNEIFILRTDPEVIKYIDRTPPTEVKEIEDFLIRTDADTSNNIGITWGMQLHGENKIIGYLSFWRTIPENHRAEIGYALMKEYWQKGFMTEAIDAILNYGFSEMKLHSVEANINPLNIASMKILKQFQFVQEAHFKEDYYFEGNFLDSVIFSLLARNYRPVFERKG